MNSKPWSKAVLSSLLLLLSFLITQCAARKEELNTHGEMTPMGMSSRDRVFSLSEVNLEKVFEECAGMMILEENATTIRDYYRGGVQEKERAERLMKEGKWKEAEDHFEKSNQYLEVVTEYFPEDDPHRDVYENHAVIFMPNLIMADNELKLARLYRKMNKREDIYWAIRRGRQDLHQSLKSAETEWAFKLQEEFQKESAEK